MKRALSLVLAACILFATASAFAAETAANKPIADTPAKITGRVTTVTVVHDGNDSLGTRFATRVKELLNTSTLFKLEEKNVPKIKIQINSKSEFAERPGIGSVYSIIWLFSQSDSHLGYLLANEVGTLTPEEIDALAYKVIERSDGIGVKYGYLFEK